MIYRLYTLDNGTWKRRDETIFASRAFEQWEKHRAEKYALLVFMLPGYEKTGVFAMWSKSITKAESDLLRAQIEKAA